MIPTRAPRRLPVNCASCGAIPSNWKSSKIFITPSPKRWARPCGVRRFRPISKSAATIPARCSTTQAKSSPWATTCRCIWDRCPCRCGRRLQHGGMEPGDVVMLNDPFRGGTHLAGHHAGRAGVCGGGVAPRSQQKPAGPDFYVAREPIMLTSGERIRVDGTLPRDLSGRISHSAGEDYAGRRYAVRCAGAAAEQRSHAGGARRRSGSANRGLPHGVRAPAGGLPALRNGAGETRGREDLLEYSEELMRAFLLHVPAGRI